MLKRALVGFLFGLTVFASGLDFGGPRAAHALHGSGGYWDGMETGCPSAGEYGLAGHCPSAAAACQSFENSSGWEWVQTKPDYDGEGRLIAYYCVLERHSPIGVLYPEYRTHPHCPTGWVDASTESGCLGNYGIPRAQGDPCSKVGSLGTTGVVGAGNPINLVGYSKYEHAVDFATAGPEVLSFERSYNSRDHNVYRTMTGHGWKTSFDGRLAFEPSWDSVSKVHLTRPTGQMITFTKSGSSFIPPPDIKNVTLTHDSATLYYTLKHGNNDAELYNRHGYLLRITRPSGYQISFEYTFFEDVGHSRKIRAYDSLGREIFFTYSNRKLATVTATDGRVYKYIYGDGVFGANDLLTEVVYPDDTPATDADNPRVIYHYEDTRFPYSLTGITNEAGDRYATFTYSPNNLPLSTEHAGGADLTEVRYVTSETRSVTNPLGKKANYNFALIQGMRRLTSIDGEASANCPAASRFVTYDADAQVTSRTDWEGNTTAYVNNSRGLPTSITEAQGTPEARTTTIAWHPSLTLPTQVTEPGRRTDYTYTAGGQVLTRTVTDLTTHTVPYATNGRTRVWTYTYDAAGLLASVDGPRTDVSDVTTYAYTANGYLATVTNAAGHVTTVTAHDGMGRPLSITDANNVVTDLAYDPRGRLLSVTVNGAGGNAVTAMAYSPAGDVLRVTRPDGSYLDFVYDAARRLTAIQDNLGQRIEYTLDPMGNRTATVVKDAAAAITRSMTATFDELGRLMDSIGAGAQVTSFAHDKNSNVVSVTDPLNRQTAQAYDALERLIQVTDAAQGAVPLAYDAQDNLTQVTDQRGLQTAYVADGFGEVIQTSSPDTGVTVNVYDEAGNLIQTTDARGVVTDFAYDALNRVTAKSFPAAPAENVAYAYDAPAAGFGVGRLTSISDPSGGTTFDYDERGNVVAETRTIAGTPFVTAYAYDLADNLVAVTYPSGRVVTYLRDALGRVSTVKSRPTAQGSDVTLAANIAYLPFGPVSALDYGNGLALARTFDADYRMTAQSVTATGATAQDLAYGHDLASNVTAANDNRVPGRSQAYSYDALDRLTQGTGLYGQLDYTYDAVGNRLTRSRTGAGGFSETYAYAANDNRLASVSGGASSRSFTYTAAGQVTGDGTLSFTIDSAGRNVEAKLGGSLLARYGYNALGERVAKHLPNGKGPPHNPQTDATVFHFATSGQLLAVSDEAGADWTEYVWLGAMPIAQIDAGTIYYTHADHLGAPQALTDASKNIVWDGSFTPFGEAESLSGTVTQNLRFPGQYFDAETGTHYNYFRDYDPALGRYLSSDPIGLAGGLNTYAYVGGNPVGAVDPDGLAAKRLLLGAIEGGAFEAGRQLFVEGRSFRCLDWRLIGMGALAGAGLNHFLSKFFALIRALRVARALARGRLPGRGLRAGGGALAGAQSGGKPIHKNSLDYVGQTHVYSIKGPNGTHKIGQSAQGTKVSDGTSIRAEKQARMLRKTMGADFRTTIRKTFPDKRSAREYETQLIERFRRRYGPGALPGNLTNR